MNDNGTSNKNPDEMERLTENEQITALLEIAADGEKLTMFIAQPDQPFVRFADTGEVFPLRSRRFQCWLTDINWVTNEFVPSKRVFDQAVLLLEAQAWENAAEEDSIGDSILAQVILAAVGSKDGWVGTTTQLFRLMKNRGTDAVKEARPKTAAVLGRSLGRLVTAFRKEGFELEQYRTSKARCWSIRRVAGELSPEEINPETMFIPNPPKISRDGRHPGNLLDPSSHNSSAVEEIEPNMTHDGVFGPDEDAEMRRQHEELDALAMENA